MAKLTKQQTFLTLLDQIDWPENMMDDNFAQATVEKVHVHKKTRALDFHLHFPTTLDFQTFLQFEQQVNQTFSDIAQVNLFFDVSRPQYHSQLLLNYWQWAIRTCAEQGAIFKKTCAMCQPAIAGQTITITTPNEKFKQVLDKGGLASVKAQYAKAGFKALSFQTILDASSENEVLNEVQAKQAQHISDLTEQALASLKAKAESQAKEASGTPHVVSGPVVFGRAIPEEAQITPLNEIVREEAPLVIEGYVFDKEVKELKDGKKILTLRITDYTSSIEVKMFINRNNNREQTLLASTDKGDWLKVKGPVKFDTFSQELAMRPYDVNKIAHQGRTDEAPEKRIELHLHSNMSAMDATNSIKDYVKQAAKWGHEAIAITDHAVLQAYPEACQAGKANGIKILYGVEANIVAEDSPIAYNDAPVDLKDATYVVFDVETTGLSAQYDKIIELSAVKMQAGEVIDKFEYFIDPGHPLSDTTIRLTSITDDMVKGYPPEEVVLQKFSEFCGDSILVGHNATFDIDFVNATYARHHMPLISQPWIDTLPMARFLYPDMKRFRLNNLAKKFNVNLEQHHRAIYDAEATGGIYFAMLKDMMANCDVKEHADLNKIAKRPDSYKQQHPFHATIYAKDQAGLKNLFKLTSESMINYFHKVPLIPRKVLDKYREGLLVGSACADGEVFTAMMQKGYQAARTKAQYYDFLEIQPESLYNPLIERELVKDRTTLHDIVKKMVELGAELNIPVAATGDVHYLNPEDHIYREILIKAEQGNRLNRLSEFPKAHFRTTEEMLAELAFLGPEKAKQVVIDAPHQINEMIENISPLRDELYTPKMPGVDEELRALTLQTAKEMYGDPLPKIVADRIKKELDSIIGNGFAVIYLISQKLVAKSNKDGYLVGSRGSVGSSLVATMSGITEVNPLAPHYRCPNCQYSEFFENGEYGSGFDLPDKDCPKCGAQLFKDGQDIPFETFLGFHGDKVPDIDLNFSGVYQPIAHNYTKVLFGENNVYRAGTIGTVADKTAYGFVKGYERDHDLTLRKVEIERLTQGTTGVKRTTGQHPAGILVVPEDMDIYDFTPIQYPADDLTAAWKTTHFDFHSIHDNILKLDILGHDDPTMIRMLQDLSGIDPKTIPMDDPGVMSLFSHPDALNVTPAQINSETGTLGLPEFGTNFVRNMLEETHPSTYSALLKISGLSHGTDVWLGNAQDLIRNGTVTIDSVIGCRDDIMMDLIHMGVEESLAFKIMERVRKGKGIPDDWQEAMHEANVPQWYIDACLKIKYMFPKAHATAYVMMALRIAYFKVYLPLIYYAAYFSVRASDFDLVAMAHGKETTKAAIKEIKARQPKITAKDKSLLVVLEIANEMLERGFKFKMVDLNKSDATNWLIEGDSLIAPFIAIPGLGENVAKQIVAARAQGEFLSKEDLSHRGKVSQTIIQYMTENHVLDGIPEENQLSLFENLF